jgi:hypothetical protein
MPTLSVFHCLFINTVLLCISHHPTTRSLFDATESKAKGRGYMGILQESGGLVSIPNHSFCSAAVYKTSSPMNAIDPTNLKSISSDVCTFNKDCQISSALWTAITGTEIVSANPKCYKGM